MSEHAPLPPSSAWIWVACPGQPEMLRRVAPLPRDDEAAREGTAAHWAGEEMIRGRIVAEGQIAPNGVVLTEALIESAEVWSRHVLRRLGASTTRPVEGRTYGIEQRVSMPTIHADNWGTPDFWLHDVNAGMLYVDDFKNGHGIVEVFEAWQLIDYAAGIPTHLRIDQVTFTIVQPNAYHRDGPIRSWTVPYAALTTYWDRLRVAAQGGPVRPGPQCKNCDARHGCEALQRDAYRSADLAREAAALELPPAALGLELAMLTDAAARLQSRITGLEAQADAMLRAGSSVPGWGREAGESRLKWNVPTDVLRVLGEAAGVPLVKAAAITPTQARAAGLDPKLVEQYASRPAAAMKLTRADESLGRRVFSIAPAAN